MLRRVTLIRTDVSEELTASIIRVTRIRELGTLLVTSNTVLLRSVLWLLVITNVLRSSPILATQMMETIRCFETSVLTRAYFFAACFGC
jgi:hypothetical protein